MKKFLAILLSTVALSASLAFATSAVWTSSHTATVDTTKVLCKNGRAILHAVCVNTGAAGSLSVFNSSGVVTSTIAIVNTAAVIPCSQYDIQVSSGLTYSNSATADVTMTYLCY